MTMIMMMLGYESGVESIIYKSTEFIGNTDNKKTIYVEEEVKAWRELRIFPT